MKVSVITRLAMLSLVVGGCAAQEPTRALSQAREVYAEAESGPAARYVPAEVLAARKALEKAERAHAMNPGSTKEAHLAYIAHRKALQARAIAQQKMAKGEIEMAKQEYQQVLVTQRNEAQTQLEKQRSEFEGKAGEQLNEQLTEKQRQLTEERAARMQAEEAAQRALESLREVANVKAEETRTTITVSGEVLFKTAESELLPTAETRLGKVAEVLAEQGEDKEIIVQGHTDSRGSEAYNQVLSQRRAESVKNYLIRHGVDADRITAVGRGEMNPLAPNDNSSGRALNRRVEIVVDDVAATTKTTPDTPE